MHLVERLSERLSEPVQERDRDRAALHVLDWIGCALIGARSPLGSAVRRLGLDRRSARHVVGPGHRSDEENALINGSLGNILELDDLDRQSIVHPGPVVVPAALAAIKMSTASSTRLLDAVTRGYEAAILVGRSFGHGHYEYWHPTATAGTFGAAAAASSAWELTIQQQADALGHAGTLAAGLWQCRLDGADSKAIHCGHAARSGLTAARCAAAGIRGAHRILEGDKGVYVAMCKDPDPSLVASGGAWKIHELTLKPWPACRHAHAAIDCALRLRSELRGREVGTVSVSTYLDALAFCDRPTPRSDHDARFSIQHLVAIALLDGEITLASSSPASRSRADVEQLARRIRVVEDARWTTRFPSIYGASLEAEVGTTRICLDVAYPLGDPENPLTSAQVIAKAVDLARHAGLPLDGAQRLADETLRLSEDGDFWAWCHLFEAALQSIAYEKHLNQET